MSTLTLNWKTSVEERHSLEIDLADAPAWLQETIAEGIALDSPWRIMGPEGLIDGIVDQERAVQIADSLHSFLGDNEIKPDSESVIERELQDWRVS